MAGELETLLKAWSNSRKIGINAQDEEGKYFLVFDGRYEVGMSQLGQSIYLESDLAEIPVKRELAQDLVERLMEHQLAQSKSGPDVLSLSNDGKNLTMFRVLKAGRLELNDFEKALGGFVNALAYMSSLIEAPMRKAPEPSHINAQIFMP
ncbi:MAG: CesT family type III secretion system chaperone [Pseudomonadota bacterium]